ncbi:cation:proton antiporter [Candidatus Parcubacteria bacterium]|nr:cation:proton antiporter [Candidatus Parcubacteria bacterium]
MDLILKLIIILLISRFFGYFAKRLHLSTVIGLIFAGILISSFFKDSLIGSHDHLIFVLSNLGLLALMFLSGLEISGNILYKEERHAIVVTFFTIISSFVLGTLAILLLGFELETALVMGICFGITAEATKARVLIQLKKMNTKIGALLMGTGITNDLVGIFLFIILVYFFTDNISYNEVALISASVLMFFLGMGVHAVFDRFTLRIKIVEYILLFSIVPFFFVEMGIHFNNSIGSINLWILLVVMIVSMTGQMVGVFFAGPIIKLRPKQLYLLGWGMNAKGAVELAIALIAFKLSLITAELYSSLLITVLVSTILFQIVIFRMVKNNPKIMD